MVTIGPFIAGPHGPLQRDLGAGKHARTAQRNGTCLCAVSAQGSGQCLWLLGSFTAQCSAALLPQSLRSSQRLASPGPASWAEGVSRVLCKVHLGKCAPCLFKSICRVDPTVHRVLSILTPLTCTFAERIHSGKVQKRKVAELGQEEVSGDKTHFVLMMGEAVQTCICKANSLHVM